MTARTDIQSNSGAILSISASLPATYDAAGYGATAITYTAVGQIEDFGTHGVKKTITEFTPVATAIVAKVSGSKNYGTKSLTIGHLPGDAGQVIMKAASESANRYSVKIAYPVGNGESTGEIQYLDVIVSGFEYQDGTVDAVRKIMCELALCRAPVVVAAT